MDANDHFIKLLKSEITKGAKEQLAQRDGKKQQAATIVASISSYNAKISDCEKELASVKATMTEDIKKGNSADTLLSRRLSLTTEIQVLQEIVTDLKDNVLPGAEVELAEAERVLAQQIIRICTDEGVIQQEKLNEIIKNQVEPFFQWQQACAEAVSDFGARDVVQYTQPMRISSFAVHHASR